MNRLFEEHKKRRVASLDGAWRFAIDPKGVGVDEKWFASLPEYETVVVPHVWNTQLGLLEYEGKAFYQREFYTEGGCLRFLFEAVLTEADVWLDGKHIGYHYGGFCQFDIIVPSVCRGVHTLTVMVSNSFDGDSIPQSFVDWYHYGGITRSVWVETLEGVSVLSSRLKYTIGEGGAASAIEYDLYNASEAELTDTVVSEILGKEIATPVTLAPHSSATLTSAPILLEGFELWSPECPRLYSLETRTSTDDLTDRVGF